MNKNWFPSSLVAALILNCAPAFAGPAADPAKSELGWRDSSGHFRAASENCLSRDNFGALLLLTADGSLWSRWSSLPGDKEPTISELTKAKRNQPIFVPVVFANPLADSKGNVNVTCVFSVRRPDGIVRHPPKAVLWQGKAVSPANCLYLGAARCAYVVEEGDPPGRYIVFANVQDNNRHLELNLRKSFVIE